MTDELKELLFKLVEDICINTGADMDGDIIRYDGKKYYVNCINKEIVEVE